MIYFIRILVTVLCYETFHKNIFEAKLFRVALFWLFRAVYWLVARRTTQILMMFGRFAIVKCGKLDFYNPHFEGFSWRRRENTKST